MLTKLYASIVLGAGIAAAPTSPLSEIPATAVPTLKCMYLVMESNPAVRSVEVYSVDQDRSVIEFTFRGPNGNDIVSDIITFGSKDHITYEYWIAPKTSGQLTIGDALAAPSFDADFGSKCHVTSVSGDMDPPLVSRDHWRRVDLPKD